MAAFPFISVPIQNHESVHGRSVQALLLNMLNLSLRTLYWTRTPVSRPVLLSALASISKYEIVISNVMMRIHSQTILDVTLAHDT